MSNLLKDKISRKDARELKRLRRSSRLRTVGTMAFIVISLGFVFAVLASVDRDHSANQRYTDSQLHSWTDDFKAQRKSYTDMVGRYGGKGAAQSFERYSLKLFTSVSQSIPADVPYNELGLASRIMLSIYLGLLQLSFILIVWWKIWLLVLVAAMVWGCWSLRPYKAKDFLGVLTNGTLFYTGIRADLENVNSDGAPNVQAQGLACPQSVPLSQAKRSAMAKILEEHDALNNTTLELVAILEFYREYPAYIAEQGEEELLAQAMDVPNLPTNAAYLLSVAFDLLNHYKAGRFSSAEVGASPTPVGEQSPEEIKAMPIEEYMQAYRSCLHRSLTPDMRSALAELSYTELAAIVLGFESGKVLAYGYEAGKWVRTSNFPQLSARAVLHSVASFSDDYDYDSRTTVRRALIYASRQSAFGPVRLPVALSATARAARQWTELQLATPHQLHATTDEVELVGIVYQAHGRWKELIFSHLRQMKPEMLDKVLVSFAQFFVPIKIALGMLRRTLDPELVPRLKELHARVARRQQLQIMNDKLNASENTELSTHQRYEILLNPLDGEQIKTLAKRHGVKESDLEDWSALRLIVSSFGWLGRRVGDDEVPQDSLIYLTYKDALDSDPDALIQGQRGMVCFRGGRLKERWGELWSDRFTPIRRVHMARTEQDYQQLLDGGVLKSDGDTAQTGGSNELSKVSGA